MEKFSKQNELYKGVFAETPAPIFLDEVKEHGENRQSRRARQRRPYNNRKMTAGRLYKLPLLVRDGAIKI